MLSLLRFPSKSFFSFVATLLVTITLAGCGNSCFVAISNNGNGVVAVKAGDPPPVCSLSPAMGTVSLTATRATPCQQCTASARVDHLYVTVRGVQVRTDSSASDSPEWVALQSGLALQPRQLDLAGGADQEILANPTRVSAGTYTAVRLQVVDENSGAVMHGRASLCGANLWNCAVLADGTIQPLRGISPSGELLVPLDTNDVAVLPDSHLELRLAFEPRFSLSLSDSRVLQNTTTLSAWATAIRFPQ